MVMKIIHIEAYETELKSRLLKKSLNVLNAYRRKTENYLSFYLKKLEKGQ